MKILPTSPRYFLIGGAPKSATTSIFYALSSHPQICPSSRKETYFFARSFDYKKVCVVEDTISGFDSYFDYCRNPSKIRMEGTPYTLYTPDAASKIQAMIPDVKILFILRDPIERLVSDFNFHIQQGHPTGKLDFEAYVLRCLDDDPNSANLLTFGLYSRYLPSFIDLLNRERILIMFYENFVAYPAVELHKLCNSLGMDVHFSDDYRPQTRNRTLGIRYASLNRISVRLEPWVARLRERLVYNRVLSGVFERLVNLGKRSLSAINDAGQKEKRTLAPALYERLVDYYHPSNLELAHLIGCTPPWKSFMSQ